MFDTATIAAETIVAPLSVATNLGDLTVPGTDTISEGRAAWTRIKTASKMMREDWRKVGEALLVGRKANRSDKLFGQWIRENGFGDMDRSTRADAMWLAESWSTVGASYSSELCHPHLVRAAYNEALTAKPEPESEDSEHAALPSPSPALPAAKEEPAAPSNPFQDGEEDDLPFDPDPPRPPRPATSAPSTPTPPPTTTPPVDENDEGEDMGILDADKSEEVQIQTQVAGLIGIKCQNVGPLFIDDFKKGANPDYLVNLARAKVIEEIREGRSPQDAVTAAKKVIRDEEERIRQDLERVLMEMGNKAMASFLKQTEGNKLLNDATAGKLLQRALDSRSSSPEERRKAVQALQSRR